MKDKQTNKKQTDIKKTSDRTKTLVMCVIILALVAVIAVLLLRKPATKQEVQKPLEMDETQDVYVKPENPVDRSKVVTMPGWGSYNIPAGTATIDKGFEFHNPEENVWYEILVSYEGEALENIVVDSGTQVKLNHYLRLANIRSNAVELKDYDKSIFEVATDEDGDLTLAAYGKFDNDSTFTIVCDDGKEYTFDLTCGYNCYYMTFSLYLGSPDDKENSELLYETALVSPGMYVQKMEMTRALEAGSYDAYVFIQPYRSDKVTKTNSGTIVIKLNVK